MIDDDFEWGLEATKLKEINQIINTSQEDTEKQDILESMPKIEIQDTLKTLLPTEPKKVASSRPILTQKKLKRPPKLQKN